MTKNNKKRANLPNNTKKVQSDMFALKTILVVALIIANVYIGMSNSVLKLQAKHYNDQMKVMENDTEQMNVKLAELTSPLRIETVALSMGLTFPKDEQTRYVKQQSSVLNDNIAFNNLTSNSEVSK